MRRFAAFAILAPCALALLALAGCQSEEEKRAEIDRIKSDVRAQVIAEMDGMVRSEVARQLSSAIEEHKRKLVEQAAAAKAAAAAKTAPAPKRK
jgi:hypothetical protein